jgi:hypothetical protein
MIGKKPTSLLLTASLAALSTVLYNLSRSEKITPNQVNSALALSVTYGVALGTILILFVFRKAQWAVLEWPFRN